MTEKQSLELQANQIERSLAQHKAPARVTGGLVFPHWIQFQVPLTSRAQASKIEGLAEELTTALDTGTCRISRHRGMVIIKIPRLDPRPVQLLPLQHGLVQRSQVPPGTAVVGLSDDGAPLLVRLPSPHVAHLLIAGDSDRQALARTIVASLALRHRRRQLGLVLIDPTRRAFGPLAGPPHLLRPVSSETRETAQVLQSLVRWTSARNNGHPKEPRIVVAINGLADLLATPSIHGTTRWALAQLLEHGREAGIHLIVCAQGPDGPEAKELAEANFPVRLVEQVTSPTEVGLVADDDETGAKRLRRPGGFVAVASGKSTPFQAAHISSRELAKIVCQTLKAENERQRSGTHAQITRATSKRSMSGRWQRARYVGRLYRTFFKVWWDKRKT